MDTCRACGEFPKSENGLSEDLQKYSEIYFNLTSIKLSAEEDSNRQRICDECHLKLLEYNRFRSVCLQVHYKLTEIKKEEPETNEMIVKVEQVFFSDNEDDALDKNISDDDSIKEKDHISSASDSDDDKPLVTQKKKRQKRAKKEPGVVYSCDRCDKTFRNEARYEGHQRMHDGLKPALCKICGQSFAKFNNLKLHMSQKHSDDKPKFACDFQDCTMVYACKQSMQAHRKTHDPNFIRLPRPKAKRSVCDECGKSFSTAKGLTKHSYIHTGEEYTKVSLPCGQCEQSFTTPYSLSRHRLRVHDPNYVAPDPVSFMCDTCGKTFNTNGTLKKHKFTHAPNEMPFVCDICEKKFPTSHKLKEHTLRHGGVKNHTCPHCGLRKITMHELRTHIKNVHVKARIIPCEFCSTVFTNITNLNTHVKTVHLGLKPYSCTVCDMAFGRSDNLKRHMKSHSRGHIPTNNVSHQLAPMTEHAK